MLHRLRVWYSDATRQQLVAAENKLFQASMGARAHDVVSSQTTVSDDGQLEMHSVELPRHSDSDDCRSPLVLMHGYHAGVGCWYRCLDLFSRDFRVIAADWLGCGLSSRPAFTATGVEETERYWVDSLERWRKAQPGLDKMILCGHSKGGYLVTAYAERYPDRVEHLVLASPVGIGHKPNGYDEQRLQSRGWTRQALTGFVFGTWGSLAPLHLVRALGATYGRRMIDGFNARRFPDDVPHKPELGEYVYQNLALDGNSAGAYGIFQLLMPFAWAHQPLVDRIHKLKVQHVTFIYGDHDWMDYKAALKTKQKCDESSSGPACAVYLCPDAGHQLMIDAPENFVACLKHGVQGTARPPGQVKHIA